VLLSFEFDFTEEIYLPLIALFGLIGLFAALGRRQYVLPLWVTLPLLLEPRSAPQYMVIPLAMLAGVGLAEVVLPGLRSATAASDRARAKIIAVFLVYLLFYALLSGYLVGFRIVQSMTLQPDERSALLWVGENASPQARFIILSGGGPVSDPLAEWFPALSDRRSLNTIFGLEWVRAVSFRRAMDQYEDLQQCMDRDAQCLTEWESAHGQSFTDVMIRKKDGGPALFHALRSDVRYTLIYDTPLIAIFERKSMH
jgi:hypothetical protein